MLKRPRFGKALIIDFLNDRRVGMGAPDLCRKQGICHVGLEASTKMGSYLSMRSASHSSEADTAAFGAAILCVDFRDKDLRKSAATCYQQQNPPSTKRSTLVQ